MINLFDDLPRQAAEELFTELLCRKGVRIERIVSTGQSTPPDKPYNQEYDEWVLLLAGSAGLWIEGEGDRKLRPGDHVPDPCPSSPSCDLDSERRAHRLARRPLLLTLSSGVRYLNPSLSELVARFDSTRGRRNTRGAALPSLHSREIL